MRFVHTSDWQIGKVFRFADDDTLAVLQEQRLEAINRIGVLARAEGARIVLVAGDVWDTPGPSERSLRNPVERMRGFPDLAWHLIPGNHDPNQPGGPWERLLRHGVPENVRLHLSPVPAPLGPDEAGHAVWLLPAALERRHAFGDPTACMDEMPTPEGSRRIGLAHGSTQSFGSDDSAARNLIAADRARRSGLDYLALGDWHGMVAAGADTWYSGTPEIDGFDRGGDGGGSVLLSDGRTAPVSHRIGRYRWHRVRATLTGTDDVDALEHRLRDLDRDDPGRVLAWAKLDGTLGLDDHARYRDRIESGVGSALRLLRIDSDRLKIEAGAADLDRLPAGALQDAARRLSDQAASERPDAPVARAALRRLLVLARGESAP